MNEIAKEGKTWIDVTDKNDRKVRPRLIVFASASDNTYEIFIQSEKFSEYHQFKYHSLREKRSWQEIRSNENKL